MKTKATLLCIGFIVASGCATLQPSPRELPLCRWAAFDYAADEHMVNELDTPYERRLFRGQVVPLDEESWPNAWPVRLEIRNAGGGLVRNLSLPVTGAFAVNGLSEDVYCFKASARGFQSVKGYLIVKRNGSALPVRIALPMGL